MNEIDNNEIKSILFDISKKYILPKYGKLNDRDIMRKINNDLVTSVDLSVEEELNNVFCKLLPNSLFVGEEKYSEFPNILKNYNINEYCWTVDPIDGTANFIKGKNKFAIMVALSFKEKILQSWIYKPLTEEICYAIQGGGCFENENKVKIEKTSTLKLSKGSISSKYWDDSYLDRILKIKDIFDEVKSYGCIGFEYVDIANGSRDFAILSKLSPWDHIPGILIVREAGGSDTYFDRGKYNHCYNKKNLIVTGDNNLANEILSLIKE